MSEFNDVCLKHGADKGSRDRHGGEGHNYAPVYEEYFSGLRSQPLRILEVGVWRGASMRLWLEYFPRCTVVGVDVEMRSKNLDDLHAEPRVQLVKADSRTVEVDGDGFDIIVDDGDHTPGVQLATYLHLRPRLKPGGTYWIEEFCRSLWVPFKNEDRAKDFLPSTRFLMRDSRRIFDRRYLRKKPCDSVLALMK